VGTAVLMLPVRLTLSSFLGKISAGLLTSGNRSAEEVLGNLLQPPVQGDQAVWDSWV
jgi:hypothetical protein